MDSTSCLPGKQFLRVDEVASLFRVTIRTVYNWCDEGKVRALKVGGVLRIEKKEIKDIINDKKQ